MAIAYFDLDWTLIDNNSGVLWVWNELRAGRITWRQGLKAGRLLVEYRLGMADLAAGVREAIAVMAGTPEQDLRERSLRFFEQEVRGHFRPGALHALQEHRARGDALVLLTTSWPHLSEAVAAELALDDVLCNRLEVDERGLFTGRPDGPVCFGRGKLHYARDHAKARSVDLADCAFYTDSYTDLPLLLAVGHPVAVNPDRRLRWAARRRGWEIVDWGRADSR